MQATINTGSRSICSALRPARTVLPAAGLGGSGAKVIKAMSAMDNSATTASAR